MARSLMSLKSASDMLSTGLGRGAAPDLHEPIGVGVGERPEDDGVDEAEGGGGGADAEREREDRRGREPAVPGGHPRGVGQVPTKLVHSEPPPSRCALRRQAPQKQATGDLPPKAPEDPITAGTTSEPASTQRKAGQLQPSKLKTSRECSRRCRSHRRTRRRPDTGSGSIRARGRSMARGCSG